MAIGWAIAFQSFILVRHLQENNPETIASAVKAYDNVSKSIKPSIKKVKVEYAYLAKQFENTHFIKTASASVK